MFWDDFRRDTRVETLFLRTLLAMMAGWMERRQAEAIAYLLEEECDSRHVGFSGRVSPRQAVCDPRS